MSSQRYLYIYDLVLTVTSVPTLVTVTEGTGTDPAAGDVESRPPPSWLGSRKPPWTLFAAVDQLNRQSPKETENCQQHKHYSVVVAAPVSTMTENQKCTHEVTTRGGCTNCKETEHNNSVTTTTTTAPRREVVPSSMIWCIPTDDLQLHPKTLVFGWIPCPPCGMWKKKILQRDEGSQTLKRPQAAQEAATPTEPLPTAGHAWETRECVSATPLALDGGYQHSGGYPAHLVVCGRRRYCNEMRGHRH
ncbi:hypothetical protein Pelo_17251 [Pelomyxa schiedti]|nr:hypothetical protein Pelo_17251 [Pelomyxa schiedti]